MTGKTELPPEVIDILLKEIAALIALVEDVRAICEPDRTDADRAILHRKDTPPLDPAPPAGHEHPPSPRL